MASDGRFRALVLTEADGKVSGQIESVDPARLPAGEVTLRVAYSGLNYKDGMILKGLGRLVRTYPHVPGIDIAGTVESSTAPAFKPGDAVICTGWRVGEVHWGGYGELARLKAEWLLPLPTGLSLRRAMAIGTAGLTAMQSLLALERHGLTPAAGEVLVTGAAGGVGSVATALLSGLGYTVVASTGRRSLDGYLTGLGATTIVDRAELAEAPKRPLLAERWAGAIDSVGSTTLANLLAGLKYGASVAACGLAGGNDLPTTVIPFLLRGVNLLGIDSVMCPMPLRQVIWSRLARDLEMAKLDAMTTVAGLDDLVALADQILNGQVRGRVVVDLSR
jgi:acrylyl-CoA reductase (NADPH)